MLNELVSPVTASAVSQSPHTREMNDESRETPGEERRESIHGMRRCRTLPTHLYRPLTPTHAREALRELTTSTRDLARLFIQPSDKCCVFLLHENGIKPTNEPPKGMHAATTPSASSYMIRPDRGHVRTSLQRDWVRGGDEDYSI